METSLIPALVLATVLAGAGPERAPIGPFESRADPAPQGTIDQLVFARLAPLGIEPANLCSDEVFVRRAYLDVIGTLPTADEARQFLRERDPFKRRALIDRLLARDEFADYWAMKWSDLLRVKAEFPINLWPNAAQAYHRWIRASLRDNMPYDRFARGLLTSSGSNFRVPPVNFYRAVQGRDPQSLAKVVALTFMGARFERWPEARRAGMAAFFSRVAYKKTDEWKEEIVYLDPTASKDLKAVFPDGKAVTIPAGADPRVAFADWLISPKNPWFARSVVNRIWAWTMGHGIIDEPDDIRPDNPPASPEVLACLEKELVQSHYDLRHIYRLIFNSRTYQQSSIPQNDEKPKVQFAHYVVRQLDAEVLIDALSWIGGEGESYSSPIPEPFTFVPKENRTIALADGSITSPFLTIFGRPSRDTGLMSERSNQPTDTQRLYLLNSSDIRKRIQRSPQLRGTAGGRNPLGAVNRIYLTILSRYPTQAEVATLRQHFRAAGASPRQAGEDLAWALINSKEFLCRH